MMPDPNRELPNENTSDASETPDDIDREYTKLVLDMFYDITGLSASIIYKDENIYSEKNWPKFCRLICKNIDDEVCNMLLPKNDEIIMCKAGLWCRAIPLRLSEGEVGYLIIGHRRIQGKDEESKRVLGNLLKFYGKYNQSNIAILLTAFENVPIVDEADLYKHQDIFIKNYLSFAVPFIKDKRIKAELVSKISVLNTQLELERKRADIELQRSNEIKSLAANLSHIILRPLQSIIGYASIINDELDELDANPKLKSYSNNMLDEIKKLAYYSENISNFMANEKARFSYTMKLANIEELIYAVILLFRREAEAKGILITDPIWMNDAPRRIECSENHIKQLLFNIYQNAVKYSFPGNTAAQRLIITQCSRDGENFRLEVKNYGTGITDDEIKQGVIFKEGYRGVLSKDSCRTGSGIGLWSVKRIIEDHGGCVRVESRQVNHSIEPDKPDVYATAITIYLPYSIKRDVNE